MKLVRLIIKMSKVKLGFIVSTLIFVCLFNVSCDLFEKDKTKEGEVVKVEPKKQAIKNEKYGSYLAGRVAHLRRDFNTAADYYVEVINKDPSNTDLINRLYVILASEGRISDASKYAREAIKAGDNNNFTYIIIAVDETKKKQYDEALKTISNLKGPVYDEFINPLMSAWVLVGEGRKEDALSVVQKLKSEPALAALYNFHAGMINDYFDEKEQAEKHYEFLMNEAKLEMSFRSLQIITNFYIRNGEKDKAVELVNRYNDDKNMVDMLVRLKHNVENASPENTEKLISDADFGLAEAMFSIAATLRQGPAGMDLAHIFICLSIYSNPDYDLAKLLLADILEGREMYDSANNIYDQIDKNKETYYTAQLKKALNFTINKEYNKAVEVLKDLKKDNPNNYQVSLDLADNLRMLRNYDEAIKYYNEAISYIDEVQEKNWVVFYALGVAYERNNEWDKAEESLKKAIELSQNHYVVMNYLGYCWITRGENIEEALSMIIDAYNQVPNDGHITDSLGWVLYKLEKYDEAVLYLEKASEIEPGNALISDHLGDAYWAAGRRIEAVYQWKHVLVLKEDIDEVDLDNVKNKIENGMETQEILNYDSQFVEEKIKEIIE